MKPDGRIVFSGLLSLGVTGRSCRVSPDSDRPDTKLVSIRVRKVLLRFFSPSAENTLYSFTTFPFPFEPPFLCQKCSSVTERSSLGMIPKGLQSFSTGESSDLTGGGNVNGRDKGPFSRATVSGVVTDGSIVGPGIRL